MRARLKARWGAKQGWAAAREKKKAHLARREGGKEGVGTRGPQCEAARWHGKGMTRRGARAQGSGSSRSLEGKRDLPVESVETTLRQSLTFTRWSVTGSEARGERMTEMREAALAS